MVMRNVAIDPGCGRAVRTGSTPGPEMRRGLGQGYFQSTGAGGGGKTAPFGHQEPIGGKA